jgi:cytoskeletal protein CcmA (bactofilin family)
MNLRARVLSAALVLTSSAALAQAAPPVPNAPAPPGAAAASSPTIQVSFRGSLRDALKKIAETGGLNLVVTGDLDRPAEVHLKGVSAEQALRTVARAYNLKLDADEGIFTLRPLTEAEIAARPAPTAPSAPLPPAAPLPPDVAKDAAEAANLGDEAVTPEEVRERVREQARRARRTGGGDNDVVARGQPLTIAKDQVVESAVVYNGTLTIDGIVEDDAVVFGGNMEVNGHVSGDATAFGGNVILNPGATVDGDVASFGGVVERREGATVAGSSESFGGNRFGKVVAEGVRAAVQDAVGEHQREQEEEAEAVADGSDEGSHHDDNPLGGFPGFLLKFGLLFGLGFLLMIFAPARMKEIEAEIRREPLKNGLVGLLGFPAFVILTILTGITIIGIPVALALVVLGLLAIVMGIAAVANAVGMRVPVLRGRKTQAAVLALGLFPMLLLFEIPVLGVIAQILVICVSVGAVIRTRLGHRGPRGFPEPLSPPSPSAL